MAKQRALLLQVYADPAEEHALPADVRLVGARGGIYRDQRDVLSPHQQFRGQRVVAQAAPAIHPGGASGNRQDAHGRLNPQVLVTRADWNARARNRNSTMLPSWGWSQLRRVVG